MQFAHDDSKETNCDIEMWGKQPKSIQKYDIDNFQDAHYIKYKMPKWFTKLNIQVQHHN